MAGQPEGTRLKDLTGTSVPRLVLPIEDLVDVVLPNARPPLARPLAHATLTPFGVDRPRRFLGQLLRQHAASVEQVWVQPRGELTLPSELRRQADAASGLTLILPGPLDLPVELRDRLFNFIENERGVFVKTAERSALVGALLEVASLGEATPMADPAAERTTDLLALWDRERSRSFLIENRPREEDWAVYGEPTRLDLLASSLEVAGTNESLTARCRLEVERLHRFFEEWFVGNFPDDDESFSVVVEALAPGFQIVTPTGVELDRDALLERLRAMHGGEPGLRIWTRLLSARRLEITPDASDASSQWVIVRYEEWQEREKTARGRTSTAVLEIDSPQRTRWHHVHETWMPETPTD